ncbi:peptidase inhibitor family I36 protein [Streptomyces tsukubensis]|uniref:peptidase inhibitor family I36 protein n=1 Tax=Streptomyces tsukubensis TaxID=83656 RepID=UPI0015C36AC7|nr:peptidase inhibitor family I36 protein [Streptomyces tsukubensis]
MQIKAKALSRFFTAFTFAAAAILFSATGAEANYDDCPGGSVCLFNDSNGTGFYRALPRCGLQNLDPGNRKAVSSVRTHGNPVELFDEKDVNVGRVGTWTKTNLSLAENDRAVKANVIC